LKADLLAESTRQASEIVAPLGSVVVQASIVIPVHNEAGILQNLIEELREHFNNFNFPIEMLICENGSSDASREIAQALAEHLTDVRLISLDKPSYGAALKAGIVRSSAEYVFIFNADLWCLNFFSKALKLLRSGTDLVVGSKCLPRSVDYRPLVRRTITHSFNAFLRMAYGFRGTDTHGLKAMRRSRIIPLLQQCRTEREVFDTELVLRAQRTGLRISEVPVTVRNVRAPRLSLLQRVPDTVKDLILIRKTL
jgi:glycosyltransferase involved in cell wall biosynthesis